LSIPNSGLVITQAIDDRGIIGPLKKATKEDPRRQGGNNPGKNIKDIESLA
jgi:hypothetical protein